MKKTYIQPAMLIARVAIQKMICASLPTAGIDTSGNIDAEQLDSRRSPNLWDDDE